MGLQSQSGEQSQGQMKEPASIIMTGKPFCCEHSGVNVEKSWQEAPRAQLQTCLKGGSLIHAHSSAWLTTYLTPPTQIHVLEP